MKIVDKLIKIFYTSYIGNVYFNFLLWLDARKNKKKVISYSNSANRVVINAAQLAYTQGLKRVKSKINNAALSLEGNYHKTLSSVSDVIELAEEEKKAHIETLKKMNVKKGQDIKNDTDKAKMIEQRIQDYKDLHKFKEERAILRQIRKAKTEGNSDLVAKLTREWEKIYVPNKYRRS